MATWARVVSFALAVCVAQGQSKPDAAEILNKVAETYKSAKQYDFAVVTTYPASAPAPHGPPFPTRLVFKAPNQYRVDGISIPLYPGESVNVIDDGSTFWMYLPQSNRYASESSDQLTPAERLIGEFRPNFDYTGEAKLLPDGAITAGGGAPVVCYVVQLGESGESWWIDKTNFRVRRVASAAFIATFTTVKLNEPLSDDLFKFTPPQGATKIELPR